MRRHAFVLVLLAACAPERPADHSVPLWGACSWDGEEDDALCQEGLICEWGQCAQPCKGFGDDLGCPSADGVQSECYDGVDDRNACIFGCLHNAPCPETGEDPLTCVEGWSWCAVQ